MKQLVLAMSLVAGLAVPAAASHLTRAGVGIDETVWIGGDVGVDGSRSARDYWNEGPTASSATKGLPMSHGAASVNLLTDPGIRLSATAASGYDALGNWVQQSWAEAGAGWQDVIRISGATAPSTLRLVFHVEGSFGFDLGELGSGVARFGMVMFPNSSNTYVFEDDAEIPDAWAAANAFQVSDIEAGASRFPTESSYLSPPARPTNFQSTPDGSVSWDAIFELYYDNALEGYDMAFYASLQAKSFNGGRTDADFGSTIRLTALTKADGSPLEGTVSFDSGFRIGSTSHPVPEPATVSLLAIGAAGLFLARRRALKAQADSGARHVGAAHPHGPRHPPEAH